MTIVGQAELEIRANGSYFASDAMRVAQPAMSRLGGVAEQTAQRSSRAFHLAFQSVAQSTAGAFAPVTETLDHVTGVLGDIQHGKFALKTTAIGSAMLGAGAGIQAWASAEQAGQQQLQVAIESTGHSWDEYADRIEKAVKAGERHGYTANTTLDALNRMTVASGSADKALNDFGFTMGAAALKHISLSHAAAQVALGYGGNLRALKSLGINLANNTKLVTAADKADKAHTTAVDALHKAETRLQQTRERLGASTSKHTDNSLALERAQTRVTTATEAARIAEAKHGALSPQYASAQARLALAEDTLTKARTAGNTATGLSVSQQITLANAEAAVKTAHEKVAQAAKEQTAAHKAAAGAVTTIDQAIAKNTGIVKQADAAANTWTGHLKALGAEVEDDAARFGQKYGPAITAAGSVVTVFGGVLSVGQAVMGRWGAAGRAAAAANEVFTATTAAQTTAAAASTEATVALTTAESTLAEVDAALGVSSGEAAVGIAAEGTAAAVAAGEMGALTAAESAAGAAGAASAGGLAGFSGALGKAGLALGAFALSYEGTSELLKHTPLGGAVSSAADSVSNWLGVGPKQAGERETKKMSTPQLRNAMGSGQYQGYVFGQRGYFTPDKQFHDWSKSPASMSAMRNAWDPKATADSLHMTLLEIARNTAKTSAHADATHKAIVRAGSGRPLSSPELATL